MNRNTTAVILAAGTSSRLRPFTDNTPKSLLHVGGRPVIAHMLEFLDWCGFEKVVVVGGFCFDKMQKEVSKYAPHACIIENKEYTKQNLLSFERAIEEIKDGNIFVCNADYIFKKDTAKKVKNNLNGISIYCSYDVRGNDNDVMVVKENGEGNVVEMSKELTQFDSIYTGMFFIDADSLGLVKKTIEAIHTKYDANDTTVEYIFRELIEKGHIVSIKDCGKVDWFEIDTPEDLIKARREFKKDK